MYISMDTVKNIAAIIGLILTIGGIAWAIIRWVLKRENTTNGLEELKETHEADIGKIQTELCELSYGLRAALDGLMQLGCNGNVTTAHERLEKHINKQAHDQL